MNIVITMAGIGRRFQEAGYQMPKYMIEAHEKTLFEWSMESLAGFNDKSNRYYFIVRTEDQSECFIREACDKLGIENYTVTGSDQTGADPQVNHIWNMVNLEGDWYQVDITWDDNYKAI